MLLVPLNFSPHAAQMRSRATHEPHSCRRPLNISPQPVQVRSRFRHAPQIRWWLVNLFPQRPQVRSRGAIPGSATGAPRARAREQLAAIFAGTLASATRSTAEPRVPYRLAAALARTLHLHDQQRRVVPVNVLPHSEHVRSVARHFPQRLLVPLNSFPQPSHVLTAVTLTLAADIPALTWSYPAHAAPQQQP